MEVVSFTLRSSYSREKNPLYLLETNRSEESGEEKALLPL
jgi:hypothetical protein